MKPSKLKPRQGKCLRYIVALTRRKESVAPSKLVNKIDWSDLPHNDLQAKATCRQLEQYGLIERLENGYQATDDGISLMRVAEAEKLWNE